MKEIKSRLVLIIFCVGIIVIGLQFLRPERTNPIADPAYELRPSDHLSKDIYSKLQRSCFDCHSNATVWPWYTQITPVNYLAAYDVNTGRARLNFSEWKNQNPRKLSSWLENISHEVRSGSMPFFLYLPLHPDAKLTDSNKIQISAWADAEQDRYRSLKE